MTAQQFRTAYMDEGLFDLPGVIARAVKDLADVDFDTMVGTGFSGGVVIPTLAMALGKKFVLVRKETDDSHHGRGRLLGQLGERWLFVDDFVGTGATRRYVTSKINDAHTYDLSFTPQPVPTTYVGQYLYVVAARNIDGRPGLSLAGEETR